MLLRPAQRKFALNVHLAASIGWVGAAAVYLVFGVVAGVSRDAEHIRYAWFAMELSGWYVIVPLAAASLLTGLLIALATTWGLFRHYWVIFSLCTTAFAFVVLLIHMPTVSTIAREARTTDATELHALGGDVLHPTVGIILLLAVQTLNVYKPKGMTRFGQRRTKRAPVNLMN